LPTLSAVKAKPEGVLQHSWWHLLVFYRIIYLLGKQRSFPLWIAERHLIYSSRL